MKVKLSVMAFFVFSLLAIGSETRIESFSISGIPDMELSNISGEITINNGPSSEVEVRYTIHDERIKVEIKQSGDQIVVETKYPKKNFNNNYRGGVDFEITFPEQGDLEVSSVSGNISIRGISGDIEVQAVSGDVEVQDMVGELEAEAVSGSVILSNINAEEVEASSVSGKVMYRGHFPGDSYEFSTVSGEVVLEVDSDASFSISGSTVSGRINNDLGADFHVSKPKYGPGSNLEGSTNGGDASVEVSSVSGRVTVRWQ